MNKGRADVIIRPVDPAHADVQALIAEADAMMIALYPPESNHLDSPSELSRPGVYFIGAIVDGKLAGTGAVKQMSDDGEYGEIKRVYVATEFRGRGIASCIMARLESYLRSESIFTARLETGIRQAGALAMYRKLGYRDCPAYGRYLEDPLSVFMEKSLDEEHQTR